MGKPVFSLQRQQNTNIKGRSGPILHLGSKHTRYYIEVIYYSCEKASLRGYMKVLTQNGEADKLYELKECQLMIINILLLFHCFPLLFFFLFY